MCHSGQRTRRAGAGTSQAVAVARSEERRGARGRRVGGRGRWMSPLCRVCPGLSPARGWLRTRVCTRTRMLGYVHTHEYTQGHGRLRPRGISQLLAGRGVPAAPPRPALTFAQIPQGSSGEGIKREPRAAPASQSPAQVSGDIPGEGRAGKGTGSGPSCPPCSPPILRSALSPAMKASLLFLLACTAVLAVGASKGRGLRRRRAQGAGGHTRGGAAAGPHAPRPTRLVLAGADTPEEPKVLVQKVQELAQKATAMAKEAINRVRGSEAAQQARCPRTPPALSPSMSLSPSLSLFPSPGAGGDPGQSPALTPCPPLPVQAVAVGQRGAGQAAAGVAQGKAGGALEEDSGPVASPGLPRNSWGRDPPGSPLLLWCSQ